MAYPHHRLIVCSPFLTYLLTICLQKNGLRIRVHRAKVLRHRKKDPGLIFLLQCVAYCFAHELSHCSWSRSLLKQLVVVVGVGVGIYYS